jgi:hypothetical protein
MPGWWSAAPRNRGFDTESYLRSRSYRYLNSVCQLHRCNGAYWVCSDTSLPPRDVVSAYAGRWSIEDTFRATKQSLGIQHPQSWSTNAPERAATLGFLQYSLVWWWFLGLDTTQQRVRPLPWYATKATPSFIDALALLRDKSWRDRILADSGRGPIRPKMIDAMLDALARAA